MQQDIARVLEFWLGELGDRAAPPDETKQRCWFRADAELDQRIREEFGGHVERAVRGELDHWAQDARGALALVIVLDQFTRNIHRRTPQAFRGDEKALATARDAVARGLDEGLHPVERAFLYMPFMHAEDPDRQERSVGMFRALAETAPEPLRPLMEEFRRHAVAHRDVIRRFGRFPTRNVTLDRTTTPEELQFLKG